MAEIILEDDELAREEKELTEKQIREEERKAKQHADWIACRHFKYIMSILEEELSIARDVDMIPMQGSMEEIGMLTVANAARVKNLKRIIKRIS